ncbi:MAG: hypothetical protein KGL43_23835 [Burkholderiales bacterium]|nr:hypothetical protein [Burkholderiales bacterium]MDE2394454.1 hypothetical protein [Burkholderiales bacterium]MDE2456629.1 hypothetical protein [Burkholderiales bacterium]
MRRLPAFPHRSCSISAQRRAVLIAAAAAAGPWRAARSQGAGSAVAQVLQARLPARPDYALTFDVHTEGETRAENRVVFASLRSTAPIDSITLIDPLQHRVWQRTPADLGWTARAQAQGRDLGDAIVLPEVRNAAGGRWTLLIHRSPERASAGRLQLAWQVLPRYELLMDASAREVAVGQSLLVTLRPRDYGVPMHGLKSIEVTWVDARGETIGHAAALENARSPEGIALTDEPGAYIARLALERTGTYLVQASQPFGEAPNQTIRKTWIEVSASGKGGSLRLASVQADRQGPGQCTRALRFRFDVDVADPGDYVCTLLLHSGEPAAPRAGGSAHLSAGRGTIDVVVSAEKWMAAGRPAKLARVTLLRIGAAGTQLLADIENMSVAAHLIDGSALCR